MAIDNPTQSPSGGGERGSVGGATTGEADTAVLALESVSKGFEAESAVEDLTLSVEEGELLTLLGPSGCGKTTTLRTIAGLERPDAGVVRIDGTAVAGDGTFVPPDRRDVGIVFQEFALFPHMSVAENVGFGIEDWPEDERAARVDELLDLVGLEGRRDRRPTELSGGQQQRVALARALAPEPTVLLLDEPFSNLDRELRVAMREEVRRILTKAGVTSVFVTHDQEEALSISDRIAVMCEGRLQQVGHPEAVFQNPTSRFVADFLGDATFLPGDVGAETVATPIGEIDLDQVRGLTRDYRGTTVDVLVRPDDVGAFSVPEGEANGHVRYRRYLGPTIRYRVELEDGTMVDAMHNHTEHVEIGDPVIVRLTADHEFAWFPREAQADPCLTALSGSG